MSRSTSWSRPLRRRLLPALVAALALVAAVLTLPTVSTAFSARTANSANALAADRLQPPSGLTATQSCPTSTIVHVSVSTAAGASSLQLQTPPGVSPGDVLVAQIGHKGSATITPPAGWTSIRRDIAYRSDNFPQVTSALFWRVVVTGEPSSATFSLGSAVEMVGGIAAYRGVSTVDAVNASGGRTGTGTTATTPSVTTTVANTMLVDFMTKWQEDLPAPVGTQQRWKLMSGTGTAHLGVSAGDVTAAGTGATATRSSASQTNSSTEWAAQTIALRPMAQQPAATLSWTASPSSWATGYKGERIVGGTVQATYTVPIGTTTVTDTALVNGTTYTYRVWAYRGTWVSTAVTTTLTPSC